MGQNSNANNNFLRGGGSGTVTNATGTNRLRGETSGTSSISLAEIVENQLRPSASDSTDPANKYIVGMRQNTTEYWNNAVGFIPEDGQIIIYTDFGTKTEISPVTGEEITVNVPGMKIGNGNAYVQDLAFIQEWDNELFLEHIRNTDIHVTLQDKSRWDNKLNCENEITDNTLILNRL